MARVGPNKYLEEKCFIEWCNADYLSNDFLEALFKNMHNIIVDEESNNGRWIVVEVFSNMELRLGFSWEYKDSICTFKCGHFDILFSSINCPEKLAWKPGGWDIYQVSWLLDDNATKRIYGIYKKYKECLNL